MSPEASSGLRPVHATGGCREGLGLRDVRAQDTDGSLRDDKLGRSEAEPLSGYVPHFDICCVNVRDMRDEDIRALEGAMLLQKVLLAFKHAYDREFWLRIFREMFILWAGTRLMRSLKGYFRRPCTIQPPTSTKEKWQH